MRALCRQSALTSPIAPRLGPLLSRAAGEDRIRALSLRMRGAWETVKSGSDSLVNERWAQVRPG
jgi:hypothetical protein